MNRFRRVVVIVASELGIAEGFLFGRLATDVQLSDPSNAAYVSGFYSGSAPRNSVSPYVVWSWQGGDDVPALGTIRVATEPLFLVRVIGRTRMFKDLEAAASRIDDLLHGSNGIYNNHRIASCMRENEYSLVEETEEDEWRHLGGYYRLYIVSQPIA